MAWVLTKGLQAFRDELNGVFPGRDKTTDGAVGDLAHQSGSSGHNPDRTGRAEYKDGDALDEVRAVDIDRDLVPGSSVDWMLVLIRWLIEGMRAGRWGAADPFRYIIYRPKGSSVTYIWHVSQGWASRKYTGSNPHDKHAHFSGGWSAAADSRTGRLGIAEIREEEDMPLTNAEIDKIAAATAAAVGALPIEDGTKKGRFLPLRTWLGWLDGQHNETRRRGDIAATEVIRQLQAGQGEIKGQLTRLAQTTTDPAAIAQAVVAMLPRELAAAVAQEISDRLARGGAGQAQG
jgi:hypothetical protein